MGQVNRLGILPHLVRIRSIDIPADDHARLSQALSTRSATFLTPTHPEFLTDWMIDKELSRRYAPLLASWAAADIVNASPLAQKFWLANGLIANTPGGGGKSYSLQNARLGRGVLLHPEGAVNWQAERVWPLHPGAADMALTLAQSLESVHDPMPVQIVPIAWRMTFTEDVSAQLISEMQLIERECGLSLWPSNDPAERLTALLGAVLSQRAHQLGLRRPDLAVARPDPGYFEAQALVFTELRCRLEREYGALPDDPMHALRAIGRGIRRRQNVDPTEATRDQQMLIEYLRLSRLDPSLYGRDTITQEQIAEVLKSTRALLVTRGWRNRLHNFLPRAVAPRVAHVRVAAPMDIRGAVALGTSATAITNRLHGSLQQLQDTLTHELEPTVGRFRRANPMEERNRYGASLAEAI